MLWVPYIELIFISFVSNILILVLVIFSSRKIVIILNWWSKRGKSGIFPSFFVTSALDWFWNQYFKVLLLGGNAINGLLKL